MTIVDATPSGTKLRSFTLDSLTERVTARDCAGDHPDGDLRLIAEERVAEDAIARAADFDNRAGIGVDDVGDVGSVDPRMPAAHAIFAPRFESCCSCHL